MVETNTNDLLGKKPIEEKLVECIFAQTNDASVNLVVCVNFLEHFCPKSFFF
jgi:hypothetical protein